MAQISGELYANDRGPQVLVLWREYKKLAKELEKAKVTEAKALETKDEEIPETTASETTAKEAPVTAAPETTVNASRTTARKVTFKEPPSPR